MYPSPGSPPRASWPGAVLAPPLLLRAHELGAPASSTPRAIYGTVVGWEALPRGGAWLVDARGQKTRKWITVITPRWRSIRSRR